MADLFLYLFKSSLCLAVFALLYQSFLARSTHFTWMRWYLLASVSLSLLLPLIPPPTLSFLTNNETSSLSAIVTPDINRWLTFTGESSEVTTSNPSFSVLTLILYSIFLGYIIGLVYKSYRLVSHLKSLQRLIRNNSQEKRPGYCIVTVAPPLPVFSFFHFLFLPTTAQQLSKKELNRIIEHELVHIRQYHSVDLLFFALVEVMLWFHPLLGILKNALREVHEYLADASVAGQGDERKAYAHLLLKMTNHQSVPLATAFAGKQLNRRIRMLAQSRSQKAKKLFFALLVPAAASLLLLFSCVDEPPAQRSDSSNQTTDTENITSSNLTSGTIIGKIHWEGNTLYDDQTLREVLGLQPGDIFDRQVLNDQLNYQPTGPDISSLYMDRGYLYFNLEVEEQVNEAGKVDLLLKIYEGEVVNVGEIIIKGNADIPEERIREKIAMQPGEVFSRAKLIKAQQAISEMGYFDSEQVNINPIPSALNNTVAIEFTVVPSNKQ